MSRARKIEVNPAGRHNFAVVVDRVIWCYAIREARGMHGASYQFHYTSAHEPIHEPAKRGSPVVVWSDKHWLSSQGFHGSGGMAKHRAVHEGKYIPLQQRIADTAERLIRKKLIVSPDERERQREERAVLARKQREEFEAASRKRLEAEARKAVREMQLPDCGGSANDRFVARIVEAMEWARSNT